MKMLLATTLLAVASMSAAIPALAAATIQREFPTGDSGTTVTYLDAAGPGHPTGCIVVITAGHPIISVSFSMFSNNKFTVGAAFAQSIPKTTTGSDATVKVNSIYILSKVANAFVSNGFHVINLAPLEDISIDVAYNAMNQITYNPTHIDVVADDAQMPSFSVPPKPGVGPALTACQQYMLKH